MDDGTPLLATSKPSSNYHINDVNTSGDADAAFSDIVRNLELDNDEVALLYLICIQYSNIYLARKF